MNDPLYRADIGGLADELRRTHGPQALDFAVQTVKQHMRTSAWKNCAMWLQVVNRLNVAAAGHKTASTQPLS